MLSLPKYEGYEELYRSHNEVLVRAKRKRDGKSVIIKAPKSKGYNENEILKQKHEFEITAELDVEVILRPLAMEQQGSAHFLIFEDFGGEPLKAVLAKRRPGRRKILQIIWQIATAVGVLHQRDIIHKNISLDSIFFNPINGQLKLSDFRYSSLLTRERQHIASLKSLDGRLAYISPEQTGRTGCGVDYRSDYYSLGVVFYELLTGRLPFEGDPMSLIYAHCSKKPVAPLAIDANIPFEVSEVVMKLLAKMPEDRYQSADGLRADLEHCLERMAGNRLDQEFIPGHKDVPSKFQLSQKFFGRENEVSILQKAIENVAAGGSSFHIISGDPGTDKLGLVLESQKEFLRAGGYFCMDAFNPVDETVPYSALRNAIRELMFQILEESDEQQQKWHEAIQAEVGPNGAVLVPIIPEIESLVESYSTPPELSGEEAAQRMERLFRGFVAALAKVAKPLVLFLKDLHCADSASLHLIQSMIEKEIPHFSFIGTCQSQYLNENPLLQPILKRLEETSPTRGLIRIRPYSPDDINNFVADSLKVSTDESRPLAQVVYEKTGGNPFFCNQFLSDLYHRKLLSYNSDESRWCWDLSKVSDIEISESMGDFLANKIETLAAETKRVLTVASIIGNSFDLNIVSVLIEKSPAETAAQLWDAVRESLVIPLGDSYRIFIPMHHEKDQSGADFVGMASVSANVEGNEHFRFAHGKIQNAAYSLLDDMEKKKFHLIVGEQLRTSGRAQNEERHFISMVNHLNFGRSLLTAPESKEELAALNFEAAMRARGASAYSSAINYCRKGMSLLEDSDDWEPLAFQIHLLRAECEFLRGHLSEAERLIQLIAGRAPTDFDLARVYDLKTILSANRGKNVDGIEAGFMALRLLNVKFPKNLDNVSAAIKEEVALFEREWQGKTIADLAHLPQVKKPEIRLALKIITNVMPLLNQTVATDGKKIMLLALRGINLSIEHGNSANSAVCYCLYGMHYYEWHRVAQPGLELGKLGIELAEKFEAGLAKCRTNNIYAAFINHWSAPAETSLTYLDRGFKAGKDYGEPVFAVYALIHKMVIQAIVEKTLVKVYRAAQEYGEYINKAGYREFYDFILSYQWMLTRLMGNEDRALDYEGLQVRLDTYQDKVPLCVHYINEAKVGLILEDYEIALERIGHAMKLDVFVKGSMLLPELLFLDALAKASVYQSASHEVQKDFHRTIEETHRKLELWADQCPENFLHLKLIIQAELMAIHERFFQTMQLYDEAIDAAYTNGYPFYIALADERAAHFYFRNDRRKIGSVYLRDAYKNYSEWGALAKCRQLEFRYPDELQGNTKSDHKSSFPEERLDDGTAHLGDLTNFLKTTRRLADEQDRDHLFVSLMKIVLNYTNAQKGYLILKSNGSQRVVIDGVAGSNAVLLKDLPVEECQGLCMAITDRVFETGQGVLCENASRSGPFADDPYIAKNREKSLLVLPIKVFGKTLGLLYLQNNLIASAFDEDHREALTLILSRVGDSVVFQKLSAPT